MDFLAVITACLIEYPPLAFVPAMMFVCLFAVSHARLLVVTALSWLAYVPYEYGMKLRLLCSGECNMRVDLIVIHPLLIVLSVASLIVFAVQTRKRKRTGAS